MFGIIKKIFLFIFRVRKDAMIVKGDIFPNIESNKLKLESIEESNLDQNQSLNTNKSNLKQDQEQKGNPFSQKLKIFFNKFLSKSEKRNFTPLKIRKKITYWKIRTKITLTSVQEISEIQLRNSINQKIKSFLRDLFESNPIKQKLMSYFHKKEETKPVKKECVLSISFKTDPNESINIINAYLYKQGLEHKEKIKIFSSKEYEKLQKINKRIEYEQHGKFLEFEAKKRREFREKNSRIFEILTDSSADYASINQKRFFDVLSHSFLEVSKTLPEIKTKIKNLEKHQRQRETKMHERILLGFGDHIKANDQGLDFYKNSLDEIHERFKEIEKNIRVLKKKDRDLSNLTNDEFLQKRLFGFEKWMKIQNMKIIKLNKDYEFQNKTLSGVINHIQKECEVQFSLTEDHLYNLQSCLSFSINDLDAQIQNLRKISLKNTEDLSQILNQNIFIKLGNYSALVKTFKNIGDSVRDFTKSFINSNKTPEILDDSEPKISKKYSDNELVKDSKVKSHGGLFRDFGLKIYDKSSDAKLSKGIENNDKSFKSLDYSGSNFPKEYLDCELFDKQIDNSGKTLEGSKDLLRDFGLKIYDKSSDAELHKGFENNIDNDHKPLKSLDDSRSNAHKEYLDCELFDKQIDNSGKTLEGSKDLLRDFGLKIYDKSSDAKLSKGIDNNDKSFKSLRFLPRGFTTFVRNFTLKASKKSSYFLKNSKTSIKIVASKTVFLLGKFSNFFKSKVLKAPKDFFISSKKFLKNIFSRR